MFKVVAKRLFWWPVTVRVPSDDRPGEMVEHSFEMQFEGIPSDRARAIDEARAKLDPSKQRAGDFLFEVSKDWRDVVDEEGNALPFTPETFGLYLQLSWHRDAVLDAYTRAMAGQAARLGNSAGPLAA